MFKSSFTLNFSNISIEEEFQNEKNINMKYYFNTTGIILTIASLVSTLTVFAFYDKNEPIFAFLYLSSCFISFYCITFNIIFNHLKQDLEHLKLLSYLNYMSLIFIMINFRYTLMHFSGINTILFSSLLTIEVNVRLYFVILKIFGFNEIFFMNTLSISVSWLVYPYLSSSEILKKQVMLLIAVTIAVSQINIFSYFMEIHNKTSFYFKYLSKQKAKWVMNILSNMKTGFLSFKENGILYMNKILFDHLKMKISDCKNVIDDSNEEFYFSNNDLIDCMPNSKELICVIINNLQYHDLSTILLNFLDDEYFSKILNNLKSECESKNDDEMFFSRILCYIQKIKGISNFSRIGENSFKSTKDNDLFFEVYCRYNLNEKVCELIFINVTNIKLIEKQKSEFKYKSLFLSKVAHEIKNPIICLTEMTRLLGLKNNQENYNKIIEQIISISDFILIVTKDFEYLSSLENDENSYPIEKNEIYLKYLIDFCANIGNSILCRTNKQNHIKFITKVDSNLPNRIISDEIRLKQILINLLSNSIKFTILGEINFDVSLELRENGSKFIKFQIRDTGPGIYDEKTLFIPFSKKNFKNNELGSGLGLSIVSELTSKIGEKIRYKTNFNYGSTFWFYIPLEVSNENTKRSKSIISISNLLPGEMEERNSIPKEIYRTDYLFSNKDSLKIKLLKKKDSELKIPYNLCFGDEIKESLKNAKLKNHYIIIVADDERICRESAINCIQKAFRKINLNLKIIEVEDGFECLNAFYEMLLAGIHIDMIFSDDEMKLLNGSVCSNIIRNVTKEKFLQPIPFYLLTSYPNSYFLDKDIYVTKIFSKPLDFESVNQEIKINLTILQ